LKQWDFFKDLKGIEKVSSVGVGISCLLAIALFLDPKLFNSEPKLESSLENTPDVQVSPTLRP
jgi:hypothetical protein